MAALVQDLLTRAYWQLIDSADRQQVCLVIAGDGPFGLLIKFVFRTKIEGRETGISIRHRLRERVRNEEAQAAGKALLRLNLQRVIEHGAVGVEVVANSTARFAGVKLWIREQRLRQVFAWSVVAKEVDIRSEKRSGDTRIVGIRAAGHRRL